MKHGNSIIQSGKNIAIFIDHEAREIMHLVASVRPSVRLFALSRLNRLTCDLHLCLCNQWAYADKRAYAVDRRFNLILMVRYICQL